MKTNEKIIPLARNQSVKAVYHREIDKVFYSYIDHKNESLDSEDLMGILAEENPALDSYGIIEQTLKTLEVVRQWLLTILPDDDARQAVERDGDHLRDCMRDMEGESS